VVPGPKRASGKRESILGFHAPPLAKPPENVGHLQKEKKQHDPMNADIGHIGPFFAEK
jgi:hypothetical protein